MNQLSIKDRVQILTALSEGVGINAACRMTGKSKNTVLKLLADVGAACAQYQDNVMRKLPCTRIEVDEIWSFIGAKEKKVRAEDVAHEDFGDCYTFTAIDPVTKLMPCWLVGVRSPECTNEFIADLKARMSNRIQLTTDGYTYNLAAVENAFGGKVDYAVLIKTYAAPMPVKDAARRYSPTAVIGTTKTRVTGNPDPNLISTSLVERANLSMRMGMRRFTRLTNAFSKKLENHMHAVSFYFMVYNFCNSNELSR